MFMHEFAIDVCAPEGIRGMIAQGEYNGCHESLKPRGLLRRGDFKLEKCFPRQKVTLLDFERHVPDDEVLQYVSEMGYAHSTFGKILALGAQYKEEQLRRTILALGSIATAPSDPRSYSPALCSAAGASGRRLRFLDICHFHRVWPTGYAFLIEKKKPAKQEPWPQVETACVMRPMGFRKPRVAA